MESSRLDTRNVAWYAAGALAALVPSILMWGFTVDDALISIRYANHLVHGAGYAFNAHGPATDGVTPLPWAFLIAPLSFGSDLVAILVRLKVVGILAYTISGAFLGKALAPRIWPLALLALAFPVGAWAASGMEMGVATALMTFAAIQFANANRAGVLAGLAAALRPELAPFAIVLGFGAALASPEHKTIRERMLPPGLALLPFVLCMVIRDVAFGSAVPLAIMAKPSDAGHGAIYAVAAMVVGLLPLMTFAPFALNKASPRAKTLIIGSFVHFFVMIAVGGDWMPFARLIVPILPALTLAVADVEAVAHKAATVARATAAIALGLYDAAGAAPSGRHVQQDRAALIEAAKPVLADAKVIAALDVGWVGAASDAPIVDLAGLTDPAIAALPGGHTSKAVDVGMLLDRNVDTVVIYIPSRQVEQRLTQADLFQERYQEKATLPLGQSVYVVFTRR